ncbi:MAG: type II secretion system ATPase GspE [Gammaproteobacteria bacterium]|jgi:general secretion pathway protein E|nr:type II secretion system ATPase GspE [Gammaproteobacteria bacterium]
MSLNQDLPFSIARRAHFLPQQEVEGRLETWVTHKVDPYVLDEFRMLSELPLRIIEVEEQKFSQALQNRYERGSDETDRIIEDIPLTDLATEIAEKGDLLESENDAPIIQLVNSMIVQALQRRASDIHIEPFEEDIVVRFRVDGVLHNVLHPPKPVQAPLMSRIKVMSNLNIAEKRLPQDGSMRVNVAQREVDVRVSVLPTAHGERIVMRLLDKEEQLTRIDQLGLAQPQRVWMDQCLSRTHGIILVTGPTGSGKSTSLYAALNAINTADKNIITIEDPIEYTLSGVGQIQVSPKIGLTFAGGLRSILRQDPDVIMVGEIRDLETAEIAVQASLTGHLVLSTLHTNDSVGAVARLSDMGVEPFLLSASLEGVVAQRLVRRLCNHCKEPYDPGEIAEVESTHYCRPKGCDHCLDTGYRGRTAIFEMLTINDEIRELITRPESTEQELRRAAERGGMFSLRQAGWQKAAEGVTSIEEVYRVTQESV